MTETGMLAAIGFIVFTYFGYPFLLWLMPLKKPNPQPRLSKGLPSISVVIPAYNERDVIAHTIRSLLQCEYPSILMDIVVVSDGSTDHTDTIVAAFQAPRVRLMRLAHRGGKQAALQAGVATTHSEIVVLADASSVFVRDALRRLIVHFSDPSVGSVFGRKQTLSGATRAGFEGGITAFRSSLLPIGFKTGFDDAYVICCRVLEMGYRNVYESDAMTLEAKARTTSDEFWRMIRVKAGAIRAFFAFGRFLNPFRYPTFSFQNLCHRLFRWIVPFALIYVFLASGLIGRPWATAFFIFQIGFYAIALVATTLGSKPARLYLLTSFVITNLSVLLAWFHVFTKHGVQQRASRKTMRELTQMSSLGSSRLAPLLKIIH